MKQKEMRVGYTTSYEVPRIEVLNVLVEHGFMLSENMSEDYDMNNNVGWD